MKKRLFGLIPPLIAIVALLVFLPQPTSSKPSPADDVNQLKVQKRQLPPLNQPRVTSVTPNPVKLVRGEKSEIVKVKGSNLGGVTSVQILLNGQVIQEVAARLIEPRSATEQNVEFVASSTAVVASNYQVRLIAGQQTIDVPIESFRIEVSAPVAAAPIAAKPIRPLTPPQEKARTVGKAPISKAFKTGPMRWTQAPAIKEDSNRPSIPPSAKVNRIVRPNREVQLQAGVLKYNKQRSIPFQPFEILDPSKKDPTPIDHNTMFTLPNGQSMTAQEYYSDLNLMEMRLNEWGYTLDTRRDPRKEIKLIEAAVKPSLNGKTITWDKSFQKDMAVKAEDFKKAMVDKQNRIQSFKTSTDMFKKTDTGIGTKSAKPAIDKITGNRFDSSDSTDYGPPTPFHKVISCGTLERGDSRLFSIYRTGEAQIDVDLDRLQVHHTMEASVHAIGQKITLIKANTTAYAPMLDGTMSINGDYYVGGVAYPQNQSITVPAGPITEWKMIPFLLVPQIMPEFVSIDESYTYRFAEPIPVAVKIGVEAGAGLIGCIYMTPLGINYFQVPSAFSDAYAEVGVDIWVAGAGGGGEIKLFDIENPLYVYLERGHHSGKKDDKLGTERTTRQQGLIRGTVPASHTLSGEYSFKNQHSALRGRFYAYAYVTVPCWDWPPWCTSRWEYDLIDWDGDSDSSWCVPLTKVNETLAKYPPGDVPGWDY